MITCYIMLLLLNIGRVLSSTIAINYEQCKKGTANESSVFVAEVDGGYIEILFPRCGLQSLYIKFTRESTSDCCDKNNENRTSSPCTKPAKRQKCSDQKSKTGTSVSTFGCFENVGLTEENPDEQFDVEWDIKTDLLRIIQGIKLSEIISSSRPELIGSITLSQQ